MSLSPASLEAKEDEVRTDEEGLRLHYDVVLCGTGLVPSILASALSRAGKTVLHCDAKDYYGELDAVVSMAALKEDGEIWKRGRKEENEEERVIGLTEPELTLHSTKSLASVPLGVLSQVETPYGKGTIASVPQPGTSLAISLHHWTLANGASPTLFVGIPSDVEDIDAYLADTCQIRSSRLVQAQQLLQQHSRSFAVDISPSLLFASGTGVHNFLQSGVADYVEFKSIEGVLWWNEQKRGGGGGGGGGTLARVPCSKGDVFGTKLLSPLEKRKLMKFLQLVMDFATQQQVHDEVGDEEEIPTDEGVQSLNERQLNQGRALARPQNKAVETDELQTLQEAIERDDVDFETYLRQTHKLSGSLLALVRHALALETTASSVSLQRGMHQLCQHLQGLGRYGTTAFLVPLYGSGEFPQAFCRSAAVHGATYLLRRRPQGIAVNEQNQISGVYLEDPDDATRSKHIPCDHVVVSQSALSKQTTSTRILRHTSVIAGNIVQDAPEQRHVILIPPGSSLGNANAIHGLVLDASCRVAPPGCCLLHLTTTVEGPAVDESVLARAARQLRGGHDEVYHICFSYKVSMSDGKGGEWPEGLRVCPPAGPRLAVDDAFAAAQTLFDKICPGMEFLALSEEMDRVVKERQFGRDEEDEEREVLDKAAAGLEEEEEEEEEEEGAAATESETSVPAESVPATSD